MRIEILGETVFFCDWLGCANPQPMGCIVDRDWAARHVPAGWRSFVALTAEGEPQLVITCTLECYEKTRRYITDGDARYRWVRLVEYRAPKTSDDDRT